MKDELKGKQQQEPISVIMNDVQQIISHFPNWKSSGPDGIQDFWLKRLTTLHERLVSNLNDCALTGNAPVTTYSFA